MGTPPLRLVTTATVAALTVILAASLGASGQRGAYDRLRCESRDGREEFCRADIAGDVRVVRQLSNTACREERNWRWTSRGITVRDGCRAEFEYRRAGSGGGWGGSGGGWGGGGGDYELVTCQSLKDRDQFCPAPIGGDVRLVRQLSDTACVQGRTWNWSRDGIRVYDGCRAEFRYRPRSEGVGAGNRQRVTCQSQKDRPSVCAAAIGGNVRVLRNISDTRCVEGRNYSWTREGVRVWDGCRAEFEYTPRN